MYAIFKAVRTDQGVFFNLIAVGTSVRGVFTSFVRADARRFVDEVRAGYPSEREKYVARTVADMNVHVTTREIIRTLLEGDPNAPAPIFVEQL